MFSTAEIVAIALAPAVLVIAALFLARAKRVRARDRAEAELEALRDEIWELRAAAAARDKAEAASLAKSRFLATVSHEIRTPLNGILGLAQLLAMTRLDAEQASYVEAIGASGRSLAQLIDDILDFSKIEAGKLEIRRERFPLAPLVEGVVELLAPRAQSKRLEIASFIAPDAPPQIEGDPARLRQVLINLLGNAVNFAERGGVGLRVSRDGARGLLFEVEDTGPGVPAHARQSIFEEFEQGDPTATRRQGGAGLGLAISRRLVDQMGGGLGIARSSEAGATFAFTLPAPPAPCAEPAPAPAPLVGLRALIVAKSAFEAPFLAQSLRGAGATAELAGAARGAGAERLFLLFSPLERRAFGEAALKDFDGWLVKPVRAASLIERLSPAARAAPEAPLAARAPTLAGLHILLAEDNEINALIVSRHLAKLGATVARATDGARALDMARAAIEGASRSFDLILMDLFMPGLDGLEATRRIRLAEAGAGARQTPILAVTASAQEEDERAARTAGVDALLTKPVEFATLAATIEELRLAPAPAFLERRAAARPGG